MKNRYLTKRALQRRLWHIPLGLFSLLLAVILSFGIAPTAFAAGASIALNTGAIVLAEVAIILIKNTLPH